MGTLYWDENDMLDIKPSQKDGEEKDLSIKLEWDSSGSKKQERVKQAEKKVKAQKYEPTWEEVWVTGYTSHTGTFKKGIFQSKASASDLEKLQQVKTATENGEIQVGVQSMKKYTKAHALRMYKELLVIRRDSTIEKMIREMPDNYYLINTIPAFEELLEDLHKEKEIAVDTETTGLNYFGTYQAEQDLIVGISITLPKADYHVYIPIRHTEGEQLPVQYVADGLKPILESETIKKILFNAKFDIHMFLNDFGVRLGGFEFCGLVGFKLLNENEKSYKLKDLASKYGKHFGFVDRSAPYEELFGKNGFEDVEFTSEQDARGRGIGVIYACKDTHLTYEFYKKFVCVHYDRLPKIKRLYHDIEKPILEVCIDMEQNGFLLDLAFAKEYSNELEIKIEALKADLHYYFGDININSVPQLQKALYDDLELPDITKNRKTDAKTLKKLRTMHKGVQVLLDYRDLNKLKSTYIDPLPLKVAKSDQRLHGTFNQVDTATGRFASKNPNLQNLPKEARSMISAPKGKIIFGSDYSQIEPRVLAHMADDETMINRYKNGEDLYMHMASEVFELPIEYCGDGVKDPTGTYEPRKRIKAVLLGIMYGMGAFTLSESIGSTVEVAQNLIDDFYETYPKIKKFVEDTHKEAEEQEFVETMFGRKRRFVGHKKVAQQYKEIVRKIVNRHKQHGIHLLEKDIKDALKADRKRSNDEKIVPFKLGKQFWEIQGKYHSANRQAVNTKIQGTSADIMKLAMIAVRPICTKYEIKMLATIHDEILFESDRNITREQVEEIEEAMKSVVNLKVPFKCDVEFMEQWGSGVDKEKWFQ
ncbi:DNA polymerase [Halobacillus karajensis]|uniref:DNA polymerase n=1 Tax=Halobacillus karajensis TaxID=195088 RepID=UPI00045C405F|nr:DNA polymerase [Halobacillus karajensis]CDQ21726.1 DNA polymerase I, thermostable [Halobacillus karajensis]